MVSYSPAPQQDQFSSYPPNASVVDLNTPVGRTFPVDAYNNTNNVNLKNVEEARMTGRTPSPTPSELKEMKTGAVDWKGMMNWKFWFRREWLWYYVLLVVILVITALVSIYHTQIVTWLTPATQWLHGLKLGWLVPIGILFVISFPPLFGHEIVAILCGLVWGLWIGFGIVAAGTFLGEVGNFYAFKYCCRARGEKAERTNISYACLAKVVRDGGFKIALIARLSAIPGHFTTGVFSTCGMNIFVFSIAAILSLPKQFITVYLGVILEQSNDGTSNSRSRIITDVVLAITFLVTVVAMWYIFRQMNKVKPEVIYARRKARQAKLSRADLYRTSSSSSSQVTLNGGAFNHNASDSDIPLTSVGEQRHQQWDKYGKAVGYAPDSNLMAPVPKRASIRFGSGIGGYGGRPRESTDEVGWDMGGGKSAQGHSGQTQAFDEVYGSSSEEDEDYDGPRGPLPPRFQQLQAQQGSPQAAYTQPQFQAPAFPPPQFQAPQPYPPSSPSQVPPQVSSTSPMRQLAQSPPRQFQNMQAVATVAGPNQTPTQATFANPWEQPGQGGYTPGQTPRQASFDAQAIQVDRAAGINGQIGGHAQEASDASFRTAFSSSPVQEEDLNRYHIPTQAQAPVSSGPTRAFSPPPPSYKSDLR
ncbi:hypothetical protein BDQ12DRAFT_110733 [Crucibulum laeve]|uniref:Golgi apparatus membrane protein TVP38 n=1 Tax=Crucibulum laeve TaxID=68775 RepID=A0A5C3M2M0_9AGAR|nr:hypothetical protein BDQ12DRAFT_110733 [Crucibulum laeve]